MNVIIAEKKDAALAIARALLPNFQEKEGYVYSNSSPYVITWAQGHLVTQQNPEEYNEQWEEWAWNNLPIIPDKIPLKPIDTKKQKEQLYTIQKLTRNCSLVINAMDSAASGELVYFYIADYLKLHHIPTKRLWTASLEANAIREALHNMKPQNFYEDLRNSGISRSKGDYILGINASRALTLLGNGKPLPMGRLIAALLAIVVKREEQRDTFEEESYYSLKASFKQGSSLLTLGYKGKRIETKEEVDRIQQALQKEPIKLDYEDSIKETYPAPLFNLTDVTVLANKKLGFPPIKTTGILQSLYLKSVISYPRTNARYVTKNEIIPMRSTFRILSAVYPKLEQNGNIDLLHVANDRLVKEEAISDHHAILPTLEIPKNLTDDEKLIYQLIVERFFVQCHPPMKKLVRKVTAKCGGYEFVKSYSQTLEAGWKGLILDFSHADEEEELDDADSFVEDESMELVQEEKEETSTLPTIEKGETEFIEAVHTARKTKAPGLYSEGSLMKQLENIGNIIEDERYKKALQGCGIGTSATRAETIKKLQDIGYFEVEKNKIYITALGLEIVSLLRKTPIGEQLLSPELTGRWEQELEQIKKGASTRNFEQSIESFCVALVDDLKTTQMEIPHEHQCPTCQAAITVTPKKYACTACDFFVWREQFKKALSNKMLSDLLKNQETSILTFTSKKKTKYKARLAMPVEQGRCQLKFM